MKFNVINCHSMRVTRHQHHKHILFDYSLHNQTLENGQSAKYLGIIFYDNMDWGQHISEISSKATKTLGFLRRNLAFAPKSTKEIEYKNLVRPKLEYAAPIWSPYLKLQINQVEKVQRTAARWTCRRWQNTKIVSEYDQEIPQSQTADNPMAPRGRATKLSPERQTKQSNQPPPPHQYDCNTRIDTK